MNAYIVSLTFGFVFILVGLLGFTPNPLLSDTGIFAVNAAHNLVHIVTGGAFIAGTFLYPGRESMVLKVMGAGGIAVTLVNFLTSGDLMLWMIHVNEADRWLHLALALVVLATGYISKDGPAARQALPEHV